MRLRHTIALFVFALLPFQVSAATFASSEDTLVIDNPINDDTYVGGGKVYVTNTIDGDLFAAGGDVTIRGNIDQDLSVAAGSVRIEGKVGDDVRIATGDARISEDIGGDLIIFSGKVDIDDITIFGDLIVLGGDVSLDGDVRGNVEVRAGSLLSNGVISGNLTFQGGEANIRGRVVGDANITAEHILLGEKAQFDSPIEYWVPGGEMDFGAAAKAGATLNTKLGPKHKGESAMEKAGIAAVLAGLMAAVATYSLLASALFIVLILLLKKTFFADAAKLLKQKPWVNMFYGLLYFLLTPVGILFFFVTIIGVPIGLSIGAVYIITLFFAKPLTSIVLAKIVELRWNKKSIALWKTALMSIGMYIALTIVGMIPLIGWLAVTAAILGSFGAMIQVDYKRFLKVR